MKTNFHHILLVDDDRNDLYFSNRALEKTLGAPSTIHPVCGAQQAIAYLIGEGEFADRRRHPFPTLVITDLNMPEGDGFELLEFIQANPGWSVVPRILLSSSSDDDDIRTAYLLGASAYHVKPSPGPATESRMRSIVEYWTSCEVPPVDANGRILETKSEGRLGARYPQPQPESPEMQRPGAHHPG